MLKFKLAGLSGPINKSPVVIGRFWGPDEGGADIYFGHNDLADRHAALEIDPDDTLWIRPLGGVDGSGTWVNGEQIFERRRIRADDEIELGPLERADGVFFLRFEVSGLAGGEYVEEGARDVTPTASDEEAAIGHEMWSLLPNLEADELMALAYRWAERALAEHAGSACQAALPGGWELAAIFGAIKIATRAEAIQALEIAQTIAEEVRARILEMRKSAATKPEAVREARLALQCLKHAATAIDCTIRNIDPGGGEMTHSGGGGIMVAERPADDPYYAQGRALCAGAWAMTAARTRSAPAGVEEARRQRREVLATGTGEPETEELARTVRAAPPPGAPIDLEITQNEHEHEHGHEDLDTDDLVEEVTDDLVESEDTGDV